MAAAAAASSSSSVVSSRTAKTEIETNLSGDEATKWETESVGTSASGKVASTTSRESKPIEPAEKTKLVETIRSWIKLENETKELNKAITERRKQKKDLTLSLLSVMKDHSIDCFDINNGSLVYTKNTVKQPVNKSHLLECLMEVFKGDPEEAQKITQYIMSSRKERIVENIRMKLDKC